MTTPYEKGNALEAAVRDIETLILRTSPSVKEKSYRIESKKIINVDGVRHEIDLFVTFELGPGYKSTFIFECKNWKDDVGKNEIIVFGEKIAATDAQRGFFVAKSFTADATAQAKKYSRMELLIAAEHGPTSTIVPFGYQTVFKKPTHVSLTFRKWGTPEDCNRLRYDLSKAVATLNGRPLDLLEYVNAWANEAMEADMGTFPSATLAEGAYQRDTTAVRTFSEPSLIINDIAIEKGSIQVVFEVYLARPAVRSHFEIDGRGRVITFEAHSFGDMTIHEVQFILDPRIPASSHKNGLHPASESLSPLFRPRSESHCSASTR